MIPELAMAAVKAKLREFGIDGRSPTVHQIKATTRRFTNVDHVWVTVGWGPTDIQYRALVGVARDRGFSLTRA